MAEIDLLTAMHTDIKWIKKSLNSKANKWTEKALVFLMIGTFSWVIKQVLSLIPAVKAFLN